MENCKTCAFYDPDYDEMRQSGDDVLVIGEDVIEKHFCRMYDHHIDPSIFNRKKQCKFHVKKD